MAQQMFRRFAFGAAGLAVLAIIGILALSPKDRIKLAGNRGNPRAVVFLTGPTEHCSTRPFFSDDGVFEVGKLDASSSCASEAVAFSPGDGVSLVERLEWKDGEDEQPLPLVEPRKVPVAFWILPESFSEVELRARWELARANQIFADSGCGLTFTEKSIVNSDPHGLLEATCAQADDLHRLVGHTPDALNVYYVGNSKERGDHCGETPDTLIISNRTADCETLAHEIGHALSLGDAQNLPDQNLMVSGSKVRESLYQGQCYRCTLNETSFLQRFSPRGLSRRVCPEGRNRGSCPDLDLGESSAPPFQAKEINEPAEVYELLTCDHCFDRALRTVGELGPEAVAPLQEALEDGPRKEEERVREHLIKAQAQLVESAPGLPGLEGYVAACLSTVKARHRIRAAQGLGYLSFLGRIKARQALQEAKEKFSSDPLVRPEIERALKAPRLPQ